MTVAHLLDLRCGPMRLVLAPALGGSIARLDWTDGSSVVPILRGGDGVPPNVLEAASFPLAPYCNRIRGGRFTFRGRTIAQEPNLAGDPSPMHGHGWLAPWTVAAHSEVAASLVYRHAADAWPWDYEARQHFRLDPVGLSVDLSCRNLSDEPMPCGLGQHPYFPCTPQTRLDTAAAHAWTIDQQVLPVEQVPAAGRYDLRDRPICGEGLDNGFGGWSGSARIDDPALPFRIALSSPDAHFFQLYSPPHGDFFAAEPVSHANAALNAPEERWPELGLRILEPGQEMGLSMRLEISPSAAPASPAS